LPGDPSPAYVVNQITDELDVVLPRKVRDTWPSKLMLTGVIDSHAAQAAVDIGADGFGVSNPDVRQFDPASVFIEVPSAIAKAFGDRLSVMLDSGIRSGEDVLRRATGTRSSIVAILSSRAFSMALG
jgi:isopentenyl diphosphate isomerase/L-lactate dehydrogenase-like FMN-dependent dehydrogenase